MPKVIVEKDPAPKEKKPNEMSLEYIKRQMQKRAATEVPSAEGDEGIQPASPAPLAETVEGTKQAVDKAVEKLEELLSQVEQERAVTPPLNSKRQKGEAQKG